MKKLANPQKIKFYTNCLLNQSSRNYIFWYDPISDLVLRTTEVIDFESDELETVFNRRDLNDKEFFEFIGEL